MGFGKDGKGQIVREFQSIDLGTLGDGSVQKANASLGITEDFRILKTEYYIQFEGQTANEDPVYVGIADNGLTGTEIAECLALDGPLDRNDYPAVEQVMRPVWVVGQLGPGTGQGIIPDHAGKGELKPKWTFSDTDGWTWFAVNSSGAALTTGTVVRIRAKHFGVWVG